MTGDQPSGWDADGPSEWDTAWTSAWTDDDLADDEELFTAADEAQLAELSALLSAVPVPSLPTAVADRINAAIAVEAATRAAASPEIPAAAADATPSALGAASAAWAVWAASAARAAETTSDTEAPSGAGTGSAAADGAPGPLDARPLGKPRTRFGLPRRGGSSERRRFPNRPLTAVAALAVCLALSGVGYGISSVTSSLNSTAAGASGNFKSQSSAGMAGPIAGASSARSANAGLVPGTARPSGTASGTPKPTSSASPASSATATNRTTPGAPSTKSASAPAPVASASSVAASTAPPVVPSAPTIATTPVPTPTPSAAPSTAPPPALTVSFSVVSTGTAYTSSVSNSTLALQIAAAVSKASPTRAPTAAQRACVAKALGSGVANIPYRLDTRSTYDGQPVFAITFGIPTKPFPIDADLVAAGNCATVLVSVTDPNN